MIQKGDVDGKNFPSKHLPLVKYFSGKILKNVKWVLFREGMSYNSEGVYCITYIIYIYRNVNILPMSKIFVLNDITLFHKIFY